LHALLDTLRVNDWRLVLLRVTKIEDRDQEDENIADFLPGVSECPAKMFTVVIIVVLRLVEVLLFGFIVHFLDFLVYDVSKVVPRNCSALFSVSPVWEDTYYDLGLFCTIRFYICDNFRFVENRFSSNFSADGINLCDLWNDFLETLVNFFELLDLLLLVKLRLHSLF